MQVVLIAGGESSRFWPLNNKHKSQIELLGKSLIQHTIESIVKSGIRDIIIVVGRNSTLSQEISYLERDLKVKLTFVTQDKPLGTGNAIALAKEHIKDKFFVFWPYKVNAGDIIKSALKLVKKTKAEVVLTGTKTETPWEFGILKVKDNKILEIVENPEKGKEPSNIKILGNYLLGLDFFEYYNSIKEHHGEDFVDALNLYIKDKHTEFLFLEEDMTALKYPWDLFNILHLLFEQRNFKSYISPLAQIGKGTVIEGTVYIGDNCKIGANNVLRGPLNLEEGVVTGALCELKHSIIGVGTHLHSGYVGNSIIGENCRFGANFVSANRRGDRKNIKPKVKGEKVDTNSTYLGTIVGDNSKFGISSGTMPGVMVGSNCAVGPGTLLFENLEDNFKTYTEYQNVKKENESC